MLERCFFFFQMPHNVVYNRDPDLNLRWKILCKIQRVFGIRYYSVFHNRVGIALYGY